MGHSCQNQNIITINFLIFFIFFYIHFYTIRYNNMSFNNANMFTSFQIKILYINREFKFLHLMEWRLDLTEKRIEVTEVRRTVTEEDVKENT